MKKVYLHGKLGKRFGRKWEIAAHTPAEIIKGLDANADGFFEYVQKKAIDGESYLLLSKPPKKIKNEEDARDSLILHNDVNIKYKSSEIHIVPLASGGAFISSALAVVGIAAGTFASTMIVAMVWGAIISVAMNLIFKPPKPPKRGTPTTTKSYLMRGASSRQSQGIAVPLGYGRLKIGAANVAVNTETMQIKDSKNESSLESYSSTEYLDLLCEGPIEGFVNKNGGTISGGDIREGIYLNDVQVRNTPSLNSEDGTFNYILNDQEDSPEGKPALKKGEAFDSTVLVDSVNSLINHDIVLVGSSPYDVNAIEIGHNLTVEAAVNNQAKIVSHFISNREVSVASFSFMTELSISKDDGSTDPNEIRFVILMVRSDGEYNVLDPESGCSITLNKDKLVVGSNQLEQNIAAANAEHDQAIAYTRETGGLFAPMGGVLLKAMRDKQIEKLKANFAAEHAVSSIRPSIAADSAFFRVSGICTSSFQFDINVKYSPTFNSSEISGGVTFKVVKLSSEYDPSVKDGVVGGLNKRRNLKLAHVKETILERMLYPNSAMVKILLDSKNFSQMPNRNYHVKLKRVLVPSNYDPVSRKYNGPWNGLFKGQEDTAQSINEISDSSRFWSDNPAWVFFDLLSSPRYGIGKYGLEESHIDKWQLYKVARYCDELVETDYPVENSTQKPRAFSCRVEQTYGQPTINIQGLSEYDFIQEFGNGVSFAGKKVAFFIYQHSFGQSQELSEEQKTAVAENSKNRSGEIVIEERIIVSSYAKQRRVLLTGPGFQDNPAVFNSEQGRTLIGACATQINYAIVEPRFVANLYLTERSEALQIINSMASIFRGMIAYSAGKVSASFDSQKSPIMLFNNSNVIDGDFNYLGVHKNKKITAAMVRFNNKDKHFKPDVVYEEDSGSMQSLGYVENETMGFGITSEGQARRLARWVLLTSQLETESIKFSTGQEASYLLPGSVFEVSDEARAGGNKGGRVLDAQTHRDRVVLSQDGQLIAHGIEKYFDPYILIDKDNLSNPILGKVDISICRPQTNETLERIQARSRSEASEDDQLVEIDSLRSSQIVRFEGLVSLDFDINNFGPQGQKTVVSNLKLKFEAEFLISDNLVKVYDHSLSDGDKVSFVSEGKLPGGIDIYSSNSGSYYVTNSTKHTFQISLTVSGQPVNIFNYGQDYFGNKGGRHYLMVSKDASLVKALSQINLGAAYSIKGLLSGTSGDKDVSTNFKDSLSVSGVLGNSWFESDFFLGMFSYHNEDWVYVFGLEWLYTAEMNGRALGSVDGFWMYFGSDNTGIGWVWTNDDLKDTFWYVEASKKWVYIIYKDDKKTLISGLFVYDDDLSLSKGEKYTLGKDREMFISMVASNGYFLVSRETDDLSNYSKPLTSQTPQVGSSQNPLYQESSVLNFVKIQSQDSSQGQDAVVVELPSNHSIEFELISSVEIFGVSTNNAFDVFINSRWQFIQLAKNRIELIDSSEASGLVSGDGFLSTPKGSLSAIKNFGFEGEFGLNSQLFRTVSVKEVTENNYEVIGLEYNDSKFFAADQKGAARSPALPVPPQADMSIPESPDGLLLFDLSV